MSYELGIDFGTTSVAAAIRRAGAQAVEVAPLAGTAATVPAVLHLARDGAVTVGDGAARLAGIDPGRVVRALKRRIGDPAPIVVGRESYTAEELAAQVVRWVVDRVAAQEGAPAAGVTLAHPAPWPAATLERLAAALAARDVPVTFVSEARAVAAAHVTQAVLTGGEPADTLAVYDLGGGRFDAAVLRRDEGGFDLQGSPEGLTDVGGLDADDLVWEHIRPGLPEGVVLDARVRRACLRAKEALSTKTEVVVRVRRGELAGEARLRRGTLEQLITPHVDRTVAVLQRVIDSAGLTAADLDAVLVVGGASRIPLVARTVSARLGRPVAVLDAPELLVARGAVLAAADDAASAESVSAGSVTVKLASVRSAPVLDGAGPRVADTERPQETVPAVPAALETPAAPSEEPTADPGSDAPTVTFPVPLRPQPSPSPRGGPAGAPPVAPVPVAEDADPEGDPVDAPGPQADVPGPADRVAVAAATADAPTAEQPEPLPAPRTTVRVPAVLESASPHRRVHSVPRLLVGAGAVVVAALVVVALFRPDGPLDPPIDPTVTEAARTTAAPVVPASVPATPAATAVDARGADTAQGHAGDPVSGFRAEGAAAAIVIPEVALRAPGSDERPAVDVNRAVVDTTPPPTPSARPTGVGTATRGSGTRSDGRPVGAAPRTPPTPAAPHA